MKFSNHLKWWMVSWMTMSSMLFLTKDNMNNIEMTEFTMLVFFWIFVLFSMLNDLDNMYSKVWKILLPMSYPSHMMSYMIYMMFYNKSYNASKSSMNLNDWSWFLMKLMFPNSLKNQKMLFQVVHSMIYHSEIWLIMFLWLAYYMDMNYFNFNNLYYYWIIWWYLTHLFLDWIHWKLPMPLIMSMIFMMIWNKKEIYWLNLKIWD